MYGRLCALLIIFMCGAGFTTGVLADESATPSDSLTVDQRWDIKRQVMSKSGVMYDMANLTDRGYIWKNDVLWEGDVLPANEKWYIAGFVFERPGFKPVWLQYAVQIDEETRELGAFKRWHGAASFR